jgi:hypothetical protein
VSKCPDLKVNFTVADVSETAKELCKNWLYKIASIRGSNFSTIFSHMIRPGFEPWIRVPER